MRILSTNYFLHCILFSCHTTDIYHILHPHLTIRKNSLQYHLLKAHFLLSLQTQSIPCHIICPRTGYTDFSQVLQEALSCKDTGLNDFVSVEQEEIWYRLTF